MKLTMTDPGRMYRGIPRTNDPIIRWKVKPLCDVFLYGFNVGKPSQKEYWRIGVRQRKFRSADAALAALQEEIDLLAQQVYA